MKKFFSLVLALVMALSLTTVAWGADMTEADIQNLLDTESTVTLTGNAAVTNGLVIAAGKTVVLDLAGNTVSMAASVAPSALITNNGTLTIKDSVGGGKLSYATTALNINSSTSTIVNTDTGVLTVESGLFENTTPDSSGTGAAYTVDNYGVLTINGGTFTSNRITLRQAEFNDNTNTVIINGGTFTGGTAGFQVNVQNDSLNMTTIINGGTFTGTYAVYTQFITGESDSSTTHVDIAGGTFNGAVYLYNRNNGSDAYPMDINVSGGTFNDVVYVYTKDSTGAAVDVPAIAGGTFATDVTDYLADGYVVDNGVVKADISGTNSAYNGLYLQSTNGGAITPANLGFYKEVAPKYDDEGKLLKNGTRAYFIADTTAYAGAYVQVNTLAEADVVAYLDAAGKTVKFFLAEITDSTYHDGVVFANFGKSCGQVNLGDAFDKTATYYTVKGVDAFVLYVSAENGAYNLKVGNQFVKVNYVAAAKNQHKIVSEMVKGEYSKIYCSVCGAEAVKAPNALSIPKGADTTGLTGYGTWYWGVAAGTSTGKVESAETFDAGIAMYVGMSVMAAAGSVVVIGKKKD